MRGVTIVFDLDGTLIDTAPDLAAATNHVLERQGLAPIDAAAIRPFVGHGALRMIEEALLAHGRRTSTEELYTMFDLFIAHYTAHIADLSRPYDEIENVLARLEHAGAILAVCTNKLEAHARQLLAALSLTHRFKAITGRDSFEWHKPDPRHLTLTIEQAGGSVANAVMIGDSETDIRTAQRAGIRVIAVDFGYSEQPVANFSPDMIISSFKELETKLACLQ